MSSPVLSAAEKRARIQGVLSVELVITKTGDVTDVDPMSGEPVLVSVTLAILKK